MFGWLTRLRRNRLLSKPEPPELKEHLLGNVWQWQYLPDDVAQAAIRWIRVFVEDKYWEGCNGLVIQPYHRYIIAGQASLMTLAYPDWFVNECRGVLLYPTGYVAPAVSHMVNNQVGIHARTARSGETSYRGPVVLNWYDVLHAGHSPNNGNSLTVHEVAHQMDFDNGPGSDGIPPLPPGVDAELWSRKFVEQLDLLRDAVADGKDVLVSDYGLSSSSELFAVSSELFFQVPHEFAELHAELFELLLSFYQRDWREWLPRFS